jgi:hypothetical protein
VINCITTSYLHDSDSPCIERPLPASCPMVSHQSSPKAFFLCSTVRSRPLSLLTCALFCGQGTRQRLTKHSYPLGFGSVDPMVDVGPPSSSLVDTFETMDNDDSVKHYLNSFINKVTCKRDSLLISEPPKHLLLNRCCHGGAGA